MTPNYAFERTRFSARAGLAFLSFLALAIAVVNSNA